MPSHHVAVIAASVNRNAVSAGRVARATILSLTTACNVTTVIIAAMDAVSAGHVPVAIERGIQKTPHVLAANHASDAVIAHLVLRAENAWKIRAVNAIDATNAAIAMMAMITLAA
jgi:hypothetical protein